jgi:hypothetical protein
MIRVNIVRELEPAWWDALVRSVNGEFRQTSHFVRIHTESFPLLQPFYAIAEEHNTPLGIALFSVDGYGQSLFISRYPPAMSRIPVRILQRVWKRATLMYGPLILDATREAEILDALVGELDRFARQHRLLAWKKIVPPIHGQTVDLEIWNPCFAKHGFQQDAWATFLVDLSVDEDTLWRRLKNSARKAIKKAQRQDIVVRPVTNAESFKKYYNLLRETGARVNRPMGLYRSLMESLWQHNTGLDVQHFFLAEQEGIPLAGQGVFSSPAVTREVILGVSDYAIQQKLYGGDLLKFEILKWAMARQCKLYDLAGVAPQPVTTAQKHIRQFKKKWGGEYTEYPVYSKRYDPPRSALLHWGQKLFKRA